MRRRLLGNRRGSSQPNYDTTGIVNHYSFDYDTDLTNITDVIRGENVKQVKGTAGLITLEPGKVNQGVKNTGDAAIGNATDAEGSAAPPALTQITGNFSINFWTKREGQTVLGNTSIVDVGSWSNRSGFGIWIDTNNNLAWRINRTFPYYASMNLPLNTWKMVTFTWDGSNSRMYLDGVLTVTAAHTAAPPEHTILYGQRSMFQRSDSTNLTFLGMLDEVSIYEVAISQERITALFNGGAGISIY